MIPIDKNSEPPNLKPSGVRPPPEIAPQTQPNLGSGPDPSPAKAPTLDPELARIFEASWAQNEEAYRFLGQ
ncbi:hypothetical protein SAMN05444166_3507 [Singulisphaera sp. GP187]|nr:hypothetical protein SAMN05444166_3507 [Singulisphaera sp. GP187]